MQRRFCFGVRSGAGRALCLRSRDPHWPGHLPRKAGVRKTGYHPDRRRHGSTRIVWGDGGKLPHPDGRPTHTFRSYTAFFRGIELRVRDLTIENDAGPGAKVGQAVAAYVDCAHTLFENVRLLGNQDTLFCALCRRRSGRRMASLARAALRPPTDGPVLPALRDRGRYRFYFWRRGRSV